MTVLNSWRLGGVITFLLFLAASLPTHADMCIEIDAGRDMLHESERPAALALMQLALQERGVPVADTDCDEVVTAYHLFLGNSVTLVVEYDQALRRATVAAVEDLPDLYSQLMPAVLAGETADNSSEFITRENVLPTQAETQRVKADQLYYLKLGMGTTHAGESRSGTSFAIGARFELDAIAVDISLFDIVAASDAEPAWVVADSSLIVTNLSGSMLSLKGLHYFDANARSSLYLGAGFGYGLDDLILEGNHYEGSGIRLGLSAGYETLRASSIRIFLQADISLPLYRIENVTKDPAFRTGESDLWMPSFALSLGTGLDWNK